VKCQFLENFDIFNDAIKHKEGVNVAEIQRLFD